MNHISRTSKLDGIRSWSLQAGETCPGSIVNGEVVLPCAGCYAKVGNYHLPRVITARADNKQAWQEPYWVEQMVAALSIDRYFRWFDSGDCYHIEMARKILRIMAATPWCDHWLPTRMYRFEKFRQVFELMDRLPNVKVRYSADSVTGQYESHHGSTVYFDVNQLDEDVTVCSAPSTANKCSGCRQCWSKEVKVVAYKTHGNKMKGITNRLTKNLTSV